MSPGDLFERHPVRSERKAGTAEDVGSTWTERCNGPEVGSPEYRAIRELTHFVDYLKLNRWQQRVLWPWVTQMGPCAREHEAGSLRAMFELGYVVGALEVEQLRTRSEAAAICRKYGVEIGNGCDGQAADGGTEAGGEAARSRGQEGRPLEECLAKAREASAARRQEGKVDPRLEEDEIEL